MHTSHVPRSFPRIFAALGFAITGLAGALSLAVWLLVHDEITKLRTLAGRARPLPLAVRSAIVAAEDPMFGGQPQSVSVRGLLPHSRRTRRCGPSPINYQLAKLITTPREPSRWAFETTLTSVVMSRLFTPEELLELYASRIYLGQAGSTQLYGVEAGSQAYFGKTVRELSLAEAATIAALIRSPHYYSPTRNPAKLRERRNRVLGEMLRLRLVVHPEYQHAVKEPMRTTLAKFI